jgi:hypothetical protein
LGCNDGADFKHFGSNRISWTFSMLRLHDLAVFDQDFPAGSEAKQGIVRSVIDGRIGTRTLGTSDETGEH